MTETNRKFVREYLSFAVLLLAMVGAMVLKTRLPI